MAMTMGVFSKSKFSVAKKLFLRGVKAPNFERQAPEKFQTSSSNENTVRQFEIWEPGAFSGAWLLELGAFIPQKVPHALNFPPRLRIQNCRAQACGGGAASFRKKFGNVFFTHAGFLNADAGNFQSQNRKKHIAIR